MVLRGRGCWAPLGHIIRIQAPRDLLGLKRMGRMLGRAVSQMVSRSATTLKTRGLNSGWQRRRDDVMDGYISAHPPTTGKVGPGVGGE